MSDVAFLWLLHGILLLVGFLFILDFPLKKPGLKTILTLMTIVIVTVGIIFAFTKYRLPKQSDKNSPIVEDLIEDIYETENS